MYDFNFFEPFLHKSGLKAASGYYMYRLVFLLLIALLSWPLYNVIHSQILSHDIARLEAEVTQNSDYPLLEQSDTLKAYIDERESKLSILKDSDKELNQNEWITEPLLFDLLSTVPKDVKLEKLAVMSRDQIMLSGSANYKYAIAELERNIRDTDRFGMLFVSTVSKETGIYSFTMNLMLKEVN